MGCCCQRCCYEYQVVVPTSEVLLWGVVVRGVVMSSSEKI